MNTRDRLPKETEMSNEQTDNTAVRRHGDAFDIRNVIGALIGFYGIVLIVVGLVADSAQQRIKTGGVNANLWAGLVMAVFAACVLVWSRLRPVVAE
jgi:drug/metabolite transporter (DMT)-like permease